MKLPLLFAFIMGYCFIAGAQNEVFKNDAAGNKVRVTENQKLNILQNAIDINITFTDGTPANLFTALDAGKTVLLDFFYTTCGYCQSYAPTIESSYQAHGAGSGDIYFWGLDNGNTNAQVDAYKTQYGVTNPCASGTEGNGNAAISSYTSNFSFTGYPTYTVICPDRTVYWDVNYPPSSTGFNTYFTNCASTTNISENNLLKEISIRKIYPSPAISEATIEFSLKNNDVVTIEVYNILGLKVFQAEFGQNIPGSYQYTFPVNSLATGTYILKLSTNQETAIQKFNIVR